MKRVPQGLIVLASLILITNGQAFAGSSVRAVIVEKQWVSEDQVRFSFDEAGETAELNTTGTLKITDQVSVDEIFANQDDLTSKYRAEFCNKPMTGHLVLYPQSIHTNEVAFLGGVIKLKDSHTVVGPTNLRIAFFIDNQTSTNFVTISCAK
jgi:hypothetical protein